jgi:predicted DNA repair protein MutK
MASGIFAVLDDIAILMDDVVMMSKLATKKTAGILGDDLAVNAEKATGFVSSRELPVLWAITKGSFVNKLIILPIVFVLSYFIPILIKYILVLGGFYLAYEGVHKILDTILHKKIEETDAAPEYEVEISDTEKNKIKSAITTDFILSLEIVIIAMGTVLDKSLSIQIMTVSVVALIATIGVYGLVGLIVRMDDFGLMLISKSKGNKVMISFGNAFIRLLPLVIRFLGIVGTIALIMVAGGIFLHNIEVVHHWMPASWPSLISESLVGIAGGLLAYFVITGTTSIIKLLKKK